jgi:hypothetical protein
MPASIAVAYDAAFGGIGEKLGAGAEAEGAGAEAEGARDELEVD